MSSKQVSAYGRKTGAAGNRMQDAKQVQTLRPTEN